MSERYDFKKAIVYARKIDLKTAPRSGSSAHRQQFAKLEDGYFFIDERWYPTTPKK